MSNVAMNNVQAISPLVPRDYLGPAEVIAGGPLEIEIELPTGARVLAKLALAFPYRPIAADTVLVIGKGKAHYVIGVIHGSGETALSFSGDVSLRAAGKLRIAGQEGVSIEGLRLEILVGAVSVVADSMVQKLTSAYQRVTGLLSVRAGSSHAVVDGASLSKSKSGLILTEETMTINGKQIHLG